MEEKLLKSKRFLAEIGIREFCTVYPQPRIPNAIAMYVNYNMATA